MDINGFLTSLQTSSAETLRAYRQDIERFETFLRSKGLRVNQVKSSTIGDFTDYLQENKGRTAAATLSPATIARRLTVVSAFYTYLHHNCDDRIKNPVEAVKYPKVCNSKPRAIDRDALATLLNGITDPRDKAIIFLFTYSGLRLSELHQLNRETITLRRRTLPSGEEQYLGIGEVIGIGNKRRVFLVGLKAVECIAQYLTTCRSKDNNEALFLSSRNERLSRRAIQQILDKWCRRLGMQHVHIHQLRHVFATRAVSAGISSVVLQELMGHASLNTTQRYFQVGQERLAREYFSVMEFIRQTALV